MKRGQTFTIEPMFVLVIELPNTGKTVDSVTADGKLTQTTTVLILDDGPEILTKRTSRSVDFFIDD